MDPKRITFSKRKIHHLPGSADRSVVADIPLFFRRNLTPDISVQAGASSFIAMGCRETPLVNYCIAFPLGIPIDLETDVYEFTFNYLAGPSTRFWVGLGSLEAIDQSGPQYPRGLLLMAGSPNQPVTVPTLVHTLERGSADITINRGWAVDRLAKDHSAASLMDDNTASPLPITFTHLFMGISGPGALFRISKLEIKTKPAIAPDGPVFDGTFGYPFELPALGSLKSSDLQVDETGVPWDKTTWVDSPARWTNESRAADRSICLETGRYVVVTLGEAYAKDNGPHSGLVTKASLQVAAEFNGVSWKIAELNRSNDLAVLSGLSEDTQPNEDLKLTESRDALIGDAAASVAVIEVVAPEGETYVPVKFNLIDVPTQIDILADTKLSSVIDVISGKDLNTVHSDTKDKGVRSQLDKALGDAYSIRWFQGSRVLIIRDNKRTIARAGSLTPEPADLSPPYESLYGDSRILWAAGLKLSPVEVPGTTRHQTLMMFAYGDGKQTINPQAVRLTPIESTQINYGQFDDSRGVGVPFVVVLNCPNEYRAVIGGSETPGTEMTHPYDVSYQHKPAGEWQDVPLADLRNETRSGQRVNYMLQLNSWLRVYRWPDGWPEALQPAGITQVRAVAYLLDIETLKTGRTEHSPVIAATQPVNPGGAVAPFTFTLTGLINLELETYLKEPRLFAIAIEWEAVDGDPDTYLQQAGVTIDHSMTAVCGADGGSVELYESDINKFAHPILRLSTDGTTVNDVRFLQSKDMEMVLSYDRFDQVYSYPKKGLSSWPDVLQHGGVSLSQSSDTIFNAVGEGTTFTVDVNQLTLIEADDYEFHVYGDLPVTIEDIDDWQGAGIHAAPMVVVLYHFPTDHAVQPIPLGWSTIILNRDDLVNNKKVKSTTTEPVTYPLSFRARLGKDSLTKLGGGVGIVTGILGGNTNYNPILMPPWGKATREWFSLSLDHTLNLDVYRLVDPAVAFDGFMPHDRPGKALVIQAETNVLPSNQLFSQYQHWQDSATAIPKYAILYSQGLKFPMAVTEAHAQHGGTVDDTHTIRLDKGKYSLNGVGDSYLNYANAMQADPPVGMGTNDKPIYQIFMSVAIFEPDGNGLALASDSFKFTYAPDGTNGYVALDTLFSDPVHFVAKADGATLKFSFILVVFTDKQRVDAPYITKVPSVGDTWTIHLTQDFEVYRLDDNTISKPIEPAKPTKPADAGPHPGYSPLYEFYGATPEGRGYPVSPLLADNLRGAITFGANDDNGDPAPDSIIRNVGTYDTVSLDQGQYVVGLRAPGDGASYDQPKPSDKPLEMFQHLTPAADHLDGVWAVLFQIVVWEMFWDAKANNWSKPTVIATSPGNNGLPTYQVPESNTLGGISKMLTPYCLAYTDYGTKERTYYNPALEPKFDVGPPDPTTGRLRMYNFSLNVVGAIANEGVNSLGGTIIPQHRFSVVVYKKGGN